MVCEQSMAITEKVKESISYSQHKFKQPSLRKGYLYQSSPIQLSNTQQPDKLRPSKLSNTQPTAKGKTSINCINKYQCIITGKSVAKTKPRVLDQNGIFQACYMAGIYHSGPGPSKVFQAQAIYQPRLLFYIPNQSRFSN